MPRCLNHRCCVLVLPGEDCDACATIARLEAEKASLSAGLDKADVAALKNESRRWDYCQALLDRIYGGRDQWMHGGAVPDELCTICTTDAIANWIEVRDENDSLRAQLAEERRVRGQMVEAMVEYGDHDPNCPAHRDNPCNCPFGAALAAAAKLEGK